MAHPKIVALRELLENRHGPAGIRAVAARLRTGIGMLDEALGGGLPGGSVVELTCGGSGGSALLVELLVELLARNAGVSAGIPVFPGSSTSAMGAAGWTALVDGCDALDPGAVPARVRPHLLWVRCRGALQALQAAELLARDGNLPLMVVDLRGCAVSALRGVSPGVWHRIQLGVESAGTRAVVFTPVPSVTSARNRLEVVVPRFSLEALERPRGALVAGFRLEFLRGHRGVAASA